MPARAGQIRDHSHAITPAVPAYATDVRSVWDVYRGRVNRSSDIPFYIVRHRRWRTPQACDVPAQFVNAFRSGCGTGSRRANAGSYRGRLRRYAVRRSSRRSCRIRSTSAGMPSPVRQLVKRNGLSPRISLESRQSGSDNDERCGDAAAFRDEDVECPAGCARVHHFDAHACGRQPRE